MGADASPEHGGVGQGISRRPEAHPLGIVIAGFWLIHRTVDRPFGQVLTSIRDTNGYAPNGRRADGKRIAGRLLDMVRGRV